MPLVPATLSAPLEKIYLDISLEATGSIKAGKIADAIDTYTKTGVPMVMHKSGQTKTTATLSAWMLGPGRAVEAQTEGGIDTSSPGAGLSAGKDALKADLKVIFSTVDGSMTAAKSAKMMTDAITKFLKSAKVMTKVTGITAGGVLAPTVTTPPPNNAKLPIDTYVGTGVGGLESNSVGAGLNKESDLATPMRDMLQKLESMPKDYDDAAQKWADMIHAYYIKASISTSNDQGTVSGGNATVTPFVPGTPPIINGIGVTTTPSSVQTGTGSGKIS